MPNYDYKYEIEVQIHFHECWDETLFITLAECEEFYNDIKAVVDDEEKDVVYKVQRIVDMITNE